MRHGPGRVADPQDFLHHLATATRSFGPRQPLVVAIAGRFFADINVVLLPTTVTTVLRVDDAAGNPLALSPENTAFANYYGLPAISIPCGADANGLPLGLQIVGKPGRRPQRPSSGLSLKHSPACCHYLF